MKLAQTFITLAMLSTFGCAVAASDAPPDTERADTAAVSTPSRTPIEREPRIAPAPSEESVHLGGQRCGGAVCGLLEACCNGRCYVPREDVHCLSDGEGASE